MTIRPPRLAEWVMARTLSQRDGDRTAVLGDLAEEFDAIADQSVEVVAAPFRGMEVGRDVRIWMPLHAQALLDPRDAGALQARTMSWLTVIGRLRAGVGLQQGARELTVTEASLAPSAGRQQARTLTLAPGRQGDSSLPQATGGPLALLFGAALLVLVIACANVSNLLLVRTTERAGEMAVRSALPPALAEPRARRRAPCPYGG